MSMRSLFVVCLGIVAITEEAVAKDDEWLFDRFQLWNLCDPMNLEIKVANRKVPKKMGPLREETVTLAARSRLRSARPYSEDATPRLFVGVFVLEHYFDVTLEYFKALRDLASGAEVIGVSYRRSVFGTASNHNHIMSAVSDLVEGFIDDYLRVNRVSCRVLER